MLDVCPSRLTHCEICNSPILLGALRVIKHRMYSRSLYYHLACWRPDPVIPLTLSALCTWKIKDRERLIEVEKWVQDWNQQFEMKEERVLAQYLGKAVSTAGTPLRRLLLEVFEYCTMTEIETTVAYACKAWFHVSRDEEYWKTRFIADFHPSETNAQCDYRRKYIVYLQGSCWHCCKLLEMKEILFKCNYYKRPLCKACAELPECHIKSVNEYSNYHYVTMATIARLSVPFFVFQKAKSSYMLLFQRYLLPWATARRQDLIKALDSEFSGRLQPEERRIIEDFDLGKYYGESYRRVAGVEKSLVEYCGRGNRKGNVEHFLADVEKIRY